MREKIIEILDKPLVDTDWYNELKSCINIGDRHIALESSAVTDRLDCLDNWFRGIIQSLFYKSNRYCLVLEGGGYTESLKHFFRELTNFYDDNRTCTSLYNSLIVHHDFEKRTLNIIEQDNFIILEENAKNLIPPAVDKRLCSYCSVTEKWVYPQRKNIIVLKIESIDWDKFNSIPKLELWQEIYNKFNDGKR